MDVDGILSTLNKNEVKYILIGGVNFLLRHEPVLTFDTDIWIKDTSENRIRLNQALINLGAEWGENEKNWKPVSKDPAWLERQGVFCLTTNYGALDVFRSVRGLGTFEECMSEAIISKTATGIPYYGLSDKHMLDCQLALEEGNRKLDRIR